jgi:hypothetical protein
MNLMEQMAVPYGVFLEMSPYERYEYLVRLNNLISQGSLHGGSAGRLLMSIISDRRRGKNGSKGLWDAELVALAEENFRDLASVSLGISLGEPEIRERRIGGSCLMSENPNKPRTLACGELGVFLIS